MMDYTHCAGIALNGERLPYRQNAVTVLPDEKDRYGLPIPKVAFRWGDNEKRLIAAARRGGL